MGRLTDVLKAGGWFGLATAVAAWYASFAAVTNSTFGRVVLPVRQLNPPAVASAGPPRSRRAVSGEVSGEGFWDGHHEKQGRTLEQELGSLLEQERFEPPEEFRRQALLSDPAIYEQANADPQAWWAKQAEDLHWFTKWDQVLDESDPPNYRWFVGGKINASYNCLDRHVEAGNGDRVAFHWRGEEGDERDVTYAELLADVQRFANALKERGIEKGDVVGIYLPMIPEVVVAMLACARIGAPHNVVFGGFSADSVRERMEFSEAKALITADGARRKGKTAAIKQAVDEEMGDLESLKTIVVVRNTGTDCDMREGRDVFYDEILAAADPQCPAEPLDAEHPLYILYSSGSTAKPKGILHTTGGYLTGVASTHKIRLRPQARVRRLLVLGRRRLGDRALLHRLRAAGQRRHLGDVRGRSRLPRQGHLVGALRALRGDDLLHRADRDPRVHEVGRRVSRAPRPEQAAPARVGGRADQPQGVALVPQGDRRRALPDRRHVVADRDRPHHDHAAARDHRDQAGLGHDARSRGSRPRSSTRRATRSIATPRVCSSLRRPWPGMLRTLYRDEDRFIETYFSKFGVDTYLVGDASRQDSDDYFWVIGRVDDVLNVSGHRMSTAEIESAIVSHEKVAEAAVIGQTDEDTGQSVCAFVTLSGISRAPTSWSPRSASTWPTGSASSRGPSASSGPTTCPRRAREDHAPAAARHRRGPRAGRRDDAARPRRDGPARGARNRRRPAALSTTSPAIPTSSPSTRRLTAAVPMCPREGPLRHEENIPTLIRALGSFRSPPAAILRRVDVDAPNLAEVGERPPSERTLADLVGYFLRLGAYGFGGPIALVGYMHRDLVEQRRWFTEDEYRQGLALAQTMPGPLAAQLAMWMGFLTRGAVGAASVAVAFVTPPFLLVTTVAVIYVQQQGSTWVHSLFRGVGPAIVAIIAIASVKLARTTNKRDPLLWAVAAGVCAVTAIAKTEIVWLFLAAGAFGVLYYGGGLPGLRVL